MYHSDDIYWYHAIVCPLESVPQIYQWFRAIATPMSPRAKPKQYVSWQRNSSLPQDPMEDNDSN